MQMSEMARFIEALRYIGLEDKMINDLVLFIEKGGDIETMLSSFGDFQFIRKDELPELQNKENNS